MSDTEEHIERVREGHGANCSSVGSVVDTLFLGAVAGGIVLAVIAAAMKRESVTVVGEKKPEAKKDDDAPAV
jgi:uncharacterized protein (DUF2062 family)